VTQRMRIVERRVADVTVLLLDGRLILDDGDRPVRDYIDQLLQQGRVQIVIDMGKVTRLDSAGIGILISKYLSALRRNGNIKLLNLTSRSSYLMDITKLSTVFEIFDTEEEAIRSFGLRPETAT
jgi:anti-sigma B factor antagonist